MDFPKKVRNVDTDREVLACKKAIYSNFGSLRFVEMKEIRRIEISKQDETNLLVVFRNKIKGSILDFLIPVKNSDIAYENLKNSFEGTPEMKITFFI